MGTEDTEFSFRPLYRQVKERLVGRLIDGSWAPGQLIPSEMQLASELGVSQGTVRKALDVMTSENLLVRRQGRGTYVAEPDESRILFQFFRLIPDSGDRSFPRSHVLSARRGTATPAEAAALLLDPGAAVCRIERLRTLEEVPLLVETITLPETRFPDFDTLGDVPNNVYALYSQRWGITIAGASEKLRAVAASAGDATQLGCAEGLPLLEITRVALDLAQSPVELRVSRCLTERAHYLSELR